MRRCVSKVRRIGCKDTAILLVFEQERATTFEACPEQEDADYAEQASYLADSGSKLFKVDARSPRSTEDVGREGVPHLSLNHR